MNKLLFFILTFSLHCAANASNSFSTLEERMSGKEFKETGIVKLTDEELAALNAWLRRHSVATLENASVKAVPITEQASASEDMRGFENKPKSGSNSNDSDVIHATIKGTFNGWKSKGELFHLSNGMVWQSTEHDTFFTKPVENAEITIKKGFMGSWSLSMNGYGSEVRVKRIK